MGRKKGRQSSGFGKDFHSKSQRAVYQHTVYVDLASEANQYRNPLQSADLGRGHGYRSAPTGDAGAGSGRWHTNGSCYGGGDKWSSIFSSRSTGNATARPQLSTSNANRATAGLSRLRHMLEERRSEDRVYDRQHRLRIQRSRMQEAGHASNRVQQSTNETFVEDRHEPGWLLSCSTQGFPGNKDPDQNDNALQSIASNGDQHAPSTKIPSLQQLAARTLGPLLPMYCAACGHDFVGDALKSVFGGILSELAISLAKSDWSVEKSSEDPDGTIFATTDGVVKALVHSGRATGLVLRGAPLVLIDDSARGEKEMDEDETRWLSDDGFLSLCPRILAMENDGDGRDRHSAFFDENEDDTCEDWETLDFDMGLNSRMAGCFYLKRLELIDIPLRQQGVSSAGGISLEALRTVLRSCSGITHLSLSGCFYNWEDIRWAASGANDINTLLCGNQSLSSVNDVVKVFGRLRGNGKATTHLIHKLLSHQLFEENSDQKSEVYGLDTLLPELKVLDVSHCSWVSPGMLIQFVFKLWERAFLPGAECDNHSSSDDEWREKAIEPNTATHQDHIALSLQHINIRGCTGLLASSSLPSWMTEWIEHGLFNGIKVSAERQVRM